jgi:hypothetical protein
VELCVPLVSDVYNIVFFKGSVRLCVGPHLSFAGIDLALVWSLSVLVVCEVDLRVIDQCSSSYDVAEVVRVVLFVVVIGGQLERA